MEIILTILGVIAMLIAFLQFSGIPDYRTILKKLAGFKQNPFAKSHTPINTPYYLTKLPSLTHKTIGRSAELSRITRAVKANKQVIAMIAFGGVGKTTLLRQWLDNFKKQDYGAFEKIFAWSFYSQGSHETQNSSAPFFEAALRFFGAEVIPRQEEEKGQLLGDLLFKKKAMLVLDGLEPLQHRVDVMEGYFKDVAVQRLLWAVKSGCYVGESVIVITSRQPIMELAGFTGYEAIDLRLLSPTEGMQLLQNLGVQGQDAELQQASEENNGHALALALLAKLVVREFAGDIAARDQLPALPTGDSVNERHARRILQFYDEKYWDKHSLARRFLYLLGLFDRPMGMLEKQVLFAQAEFAQPLAQLSRGQWRHLEGDLVQANLLLKTDLTWDCHPIVRQYFGQRFADTQAKAFRQAHQVLFEFYQARPAQHQPDTLAELEPLYRAVVHGCLAGEYKKAREEVYIERILRGDENYSFHKLGAYSQDLTALTAFFPQGWSQPVQQGLSEADQAWLLQAASFFLMSLGRLAEAVEPRRVNLKLREKQQDWENASTAAQNLVDLLLPLGRLAEAEAAAQQAIDYAQRAEDLFEEMCSYAYLATCLHRQGQLAQAAQAFATAEAVQAKRQPDDPQLYSLPGFRYCALLLDQATQPAEIEQVLAWGEYILDTHEKGTSWSSKLDFALSYLTLARCYQALQRPTEAQQQFDQAVAGIRKAGKIEFTPIFLIDRANFHLQQQAPKAAQRDLAEAEGIIQRGDMQLYAVDWHLAMCRYHQQQHNPTQAEQHRHKAKELIGVTGYELRCGEVEGCGESAYKPCASGK